MAEFTLERLTIRYSAFEDRIAIAGVSPDGQAVTLWLTQRFCALLMPKLLDWIEQQGSQSSSEPRTQTAILPRAEAESLAFKQVSAQLQKTAASPVQVPAGSQQCLVKTVDVKQRADIIQLAFPLAEGDCAIVPLKSVALSQCLAVFYARYREAAWPMTLWPDWFGQSQQQPSKALNAEMH